MTKHISSGETLRAWADALNAVATLQDAIVEQMHEYTMIDNWHWVESYRAIVRGALRTWPDRAKEDDGFELAQGLKRVAEQALEAFREEAKQHKGSKV